MCKRKHERNQTACFLTVCFLHLADLAPLDGVNQLGVFFLCARAYPHPRCSTAMTFGSHCYIDCLGTDWEHVYTSNNAPVARRKLTQQRRWMGLWLHSSENDRLTASGEAGRLRECLVPKSTACNFSILFKWSELIRKFDRRRFFEARKYKQSAMTLIVRLGTPLTSALNLCHVCASNHYEVIIHRM